MIMVCRMRTVAIWTLMPLLISLTTASGEDPASGMQLRRVSAPTQRPGASYRSGQQEGHGHFSRAKTGEGEAAEERKPKNGNLNGMVAGFVGGATVLFTILVFCWHHFYRRGEGLMPGEEVEAGPPYVVVASESANDAHAKDTDITEGRVVKKAETHVILEQEHSTFFRRISSFRRTAKHKTAPHGPGRWLAWASGRLLGRSQDSLQTTPRLNGVSPAVIGRSTAASGGAGGDGQRLAPVAEMMERGVSSQTDMASTRLSSGAVSRTTSNIDSQPATTPTHTRARPSPVITSSSREEDHHNIHQTCLSAPATPADRVGSFTHPVNTSSRLDPITPPARLLYRRSSYHHAAPRTVTGRPIEDCDFDLYGRLSVKDDSMIQPLQMDVVFRRSNTLHQGEGEEVEAERVIRLGPQLSRSAPYATHHHGDQEKAVRPPVALPCCAGGTGGGGSGEVDDVNASTSLGTSRAAVNTVVGSESEKAVQCVVCFEGRREIVFLPCGHGGICRDCAREVVLRPLQERAANPSASRNASCRPKCLLCREEIDRVLLILNCHDSTTAAEDSNNGHRDDETAPLHEKKTVEARVLYRITDPDTAPTVPSTPSFWQRLSAGQPTSAAAGGPSRLGLWQVQGGGMGMAWGGFTAGMMAGAAGRLGTTPFEWGGEADAAAYIGPWL